MAETSTTFDGFVDDVRKIVEEGGGEHTVTHKVAGRLRGLLSRSDFIPQEAAAPDAERYVMHPLYVDPQSRFSIAAAVWDVGQETPIHDHGTWGVIGIYSGLEDERRYEPGDGAPRLLAERSWGPGDVDICCTTDADLHSVRCGSDEPCVGIHVYGGDIGRIVRRAYDPATGETKPFVSSWRA